MISQEVDLVAGDFNGIAWRHRGKDNLSTIDEAFTDCALLTPPGSPPLWRPGSIPDKWADVCGFLKPPGSQLFWKVHKHGAFSIPEIPWSTSHRPKLPSRNMASSGFCFVDWSKTWSRQNAYERRISLKERPADGAYENPKRRISEVMSDHSLSS